MDKITSTEFRNSFHRLLEPTEVTVLGHVIGTWTPIDQKAALEVMKAELIDPEASKAAAVKIGDLWQDSPPDGSGVFDPRQPKRSVHDILARNNKRKG